MTTAHINRIGTAVPEHDVHDTFIRLADHMLPERRSRLLFKRMVQRAEIEHRYSTFEPGEMPTIGADRDGFYRPGHFAGTAARMRRFDTHALLSALVLLAAGIAPRDYDDAAYGVMGPIGVAGLLLESNCRV
jgi:hypothetical protein